MSTQWSRTFTAIVALLGAGVARPATSPFTLDAEHWTVAPSGSGPTASLSGGSVAMSFPATSSGSAFSGGAWSSCALTGDFDIQVDFHLLEWPFANGVRVGLGVADGTDNANGAGVVERTSFGSDQDFYGYPREVYLTHYRIDGVNGIVSTSDLAGTLRVVRTGTTLTAYHAASGGWTPIHGAAISANDLSPAISAWSHDYAFTHQEVQIALDGFRVNQGNVLCGGRILAPIDVKPGSFPNAVNLGSKGVVPVAILSTPDFDATQVDPASVTVAGAPLTVRQNGSLIGSLEDVDGDGRLDLLVHVDTQQLKVTSATTSVVVQGNTFTGTPFTGSDSIVVVP